MDVTANTVNAAMNSVASQVILEIAEARGVDVEAAAADFLSSTTARMLFDDSTKLWWDGPSSVAEDYFKETARRRDDS